jgi:catechol-2,3-dioxygenase
MAVDFDAPAKKVLSPSKLAHVVLRTNQFEKMTEFYKTFLGGQATYENEFISFISYDDEHHRIAIVQGPGTGPKILTSSGLEHIAFTYDNLESLALAYRQRKAFGMEPFWCINHGTTTSIYYKDPDGNQLETQVDNFETIDETTIFMASKQFNDNPIGTDFDPEELIRRLREGEDDKVLKKRVEIGKRELPEFFQKPTVGPTQ